MAPNHALVFGASGITGWAITKAILDGYPSEDAFASVTALTNRPLSLEDALWQPSPKLQVVSGVDILTAKGQAGLEAELKERVTHAAEITHVYFFAYIMDADPAKEISINVELLQRAVGAVEKVSRNLKFVVLPTGTKAYGVHLIDAFPFKQDLPLKEGLPRIPEPFASQMFYYNQCDMLASMSEGKPWTWCDVIPDMIVGFVPNNNIYCLAQFLSTYLSLYAEINGKGAEVAFPGTPESWVILSNDSSQDVVAKTSIWASLHPETSSGQRYNAADNAAPSSWQKKWPVICEYFGLKGVGPEKGSGPQPVEYCADHFAEWQALEKKYGLKTGRVGNDRSFGGFAYFIMTMFNFDRQLDMSQCHAMFGEGNVVETDTKTAWWTAFDRFRQAKIIP